MKKEPKLKEIIDKLAEAESYSGYLEYTLIPELISKLKELKPSKKLIEEYNLEEYFND